MTVTVIGAGLAGCEAAYQLSKRKIHVKLYDIKPNAMTLAHKSTKFGELVCSNSLRAAGLQNAVGLLKEEMRRLDSLIISCADRHAVPAGGALAVDREGFSEEITKRILENPYITFESKEIKSIPTEGLRIIATGPLTTDPLSNAIREMLSEDSLSFYDAAAPIVSFDSIDMSRAFFAARYGKGTPDYINCPMRKEEYEEFYEALITAEEAELHGFEDQKVFEGCMPVEVMARRGKDTLLYGPLKPVGLRDPNTNELYHAVVQLRQDNKEGTLYNLVGFQTHLKFGEQKRVFSMIPALKDAEFVRYGVMHRNTYLHSPKLLNERYELKATPGLFFAGQMTGVEGYVESASSGLLAGIFAAAEALSKKPPIFPKTTASGALSLYISREDVKDFQPSNVNFGIMEPYPERVRKKAEKNEKISQRALLEIDRIAEELKAWE